MDTRSQVVQCDQRDRWCYLKERSGVDRTIDAEDRRTGVRRAYGGAGLPTIGNPRVQIGDRWYSLQELERRGVSFEKAACYPASLMLRQSPTLGELASIKFDGGLYADYGMKRRTFLNLDRLSPISDDLHERNVGLLETARSTYPWSAEDRRLLLQRVHQGQIELLGDTIVNTTCERLVQSEVDHLHTFVDSLTFETLETALTTNNKTKTKRILRKLVQPDVEGVYGVVNVSRAHWVCYRVHPDSITYVDSFGPLVVPVSVAQTLSCIQQAWFGTSTSTQPTHTVRAQQDTSTCGLHAIWAMWMLACGYDHSFNIVDRRCTNTLLCIQFIRYKISVCVYTYIYI